MKKILVVLLVCFIMVSNLAACKKDSGENVTNNVDIKDEDNKDGGIQEVRFSWWGSEARHEATLEVIDYYESINPNVKIIPEYSGYEGYQDKLMAQIAGGNAPDIFTCVTEWIPTIDSSQGFYDMSGKIDVSGHSEKIIEAGSYDSKFVGINVALNSKAIIYNKTYLDELGLKVPEGDYRIADLFQIWADVYEKSGGNTYGIFDPRLRPDFPPIYGYTELQKPEPYPYTNEKLTITAEDITAIITAFDGLPGGSVMPPAEAVLIDDFVESPVANRTAMFALANAATFALFQSQTDDELAMLQLPVGPNGETANEARPGLLLSVYSGSESPDAAIDFLDFFSNSPEAAKILKTVRGVLPTPVQREALLSTDIDDVDKKIIRTVDGAYTGEVKIFVAGPLNINEVQEHLYKRIVQEYLFGKISAEEAGVKFMEEGQKILDSAK